MADLFISYRHHDSQSATGRLADDLEEHFGEGAVFRDHQSIVAGEDFVEAIRRAVVASTVLLAVIGPRWLDAASPGGTRRLDNPSDFVRLEIEMALAADIGVVPVLVEDATMPSESDLPPSLSRFARCQALQISESHWRYDVSELALALQSRFAIVSRQPGAPADASPGLMTRIATDLVDFASRPARMIAKQHTGRAADLVRALWFLLTSIFTGNVLMLVGFDIHPSPGTLLPGPWLGFVSWLLKGELMILLIVASLIWPLTFAWRLTGTRASFRDVTLVFCYLFSGAWLGFCTAALVLGAGVQSVQPGAYDRVFALVIPQTAAAAPDFEAAGRLLNASMHGSALGFALVSMVIWLGTAAWTVVAWGAFRMVFGVGRLRSVCAAAIFAAIGAGAIWLVRIVT